MREISGENWHIQPLSALVSPLNALTIEFKAVAVVLFLLQ